MPADTLGPRRVPVAPGRSELQRRRPPGLSPDLSPSPEAPSTCFGPWRLLLTALSRDDSHVASKERFEPASQRAERCFPERKSRRKGKEIVNVT